MVGINPQGPVQADAVDTHCHLFSMQGEPSEVVEAACRAGVTAPVCAGVDPELSRRSVELAESFRGVFATAGMHPHSASSLDATAGSALEEMLANPMVVAVGETGLDFYRMLSPAPDQERALRVHVRWAREFDKPLVVHVREAWEATLRILEEEGAERVVLHCFSGDEAVARESAARGYFLSFACNVTYPKNEHLRRAAAAAPLDRLLVETDSPFLAPQALRGRDNEPASVLAAIEEVARARGEDAEAVRAATTANARVAFPGLR